MNVEHATDDKMCIFCLGVNTVIIFHLFCFYIFVAIHFRNMVLKESLELFLQDNI